MTILDTSVWIALFHKEDSQHKKALALTTKLKEIVVPEYVILEVCTVLRAKAGGGVAEQFLEYALNSDNVTVLYSDSKLFGGTTKLFQHTHSKKLSFVDTALLYLSRTHDVVTFDKELARAIERNGKYSPLRQRPQGSI